MIAIGFGVAFAVLVALSAINYRDWSALICAFVLVAIWIACLVTSAGGKPPDSMGLYPVFDLIGGVVVTALWFFRPTTWKAAMSFLFLTQSALHVAFWWFKFPQLAQYALFLDVLLVLQILCNAIPGASHGLALALDRLAELREPRGRDHPVPDGGS